MAELLSGVMPDVGNYICFGKELNINYLEYYKMKVLIACEFSGIVREAFKAKGHDAWSCDLLDTEILGQHIKGDVLEILNDGWDLMIGFPPCTYLAKCGLHYLNTKPERKKKHEKAVEFFLTLYNAPINQIALENPEGWMNTNWKKPDQIIQPYYFGDKELKTTCLWLKNLQPLKYSLENNLFENKTATERPKPTKYIIRKTGKKKGQKYNYYFREGKTAKERSRTFPGIANAMADQWNF